MMTKGFASVDRTKADLRQHVTALADWVNGWISAKHGFQPYMMSFMFRLGSLRPGGMHAEVERVYARFLTECVRYPWSERNYFNRPVLIACQDWPVLKNKKKDRLHMLPSEGAHWGGVLLVPPRNRLKQDVKEHFEVAKRSAYVNPDMPLARIHVEHISHSPRYAVAYSFKSILRGRCAIDEIIVLPRSHAERPVK